MPRHHTRAGRFLVGLAALVTMLALVAAVPLVLLTAWRYLGPPLPSLHELTRPDDGTLFVRVLCLLGWASWATFTWSLLAEILAAWRGWRLPTFGWQQRTAASLVSAITMMLSSPVVAASVVPARAAPVVLAAAPHSAPSIQHDPGAAAHVTNTATTTTYIEHQVRPGEQMPTLAQRFLADKYQWHAIAAATYGLPQPDGRVLQPGDTRIYPGWTVRIPTATIIPAANANQDAGATFPKYEVKRGDWLWYVAERFLGDPERYPEIAALNPRLITATSGAHGPDHIEAGWKLRLPADARDRGARAHATGRLIAPPPSAVSNGEPDGPDTQPNTPPPGPGRGGAAPTATASPGPTASPSASPRPTASTPASPAINASPSGAASASPGINGNQQTAEDGSMLETALLIGIPLVGAGILATLLLITLRRRRHRQQHHRPVGRRLPQPTSPRVETQMRVVAEPLAVDRLDHALRALAAGLVNRPADQMPDIVGAWLTGQTINLLLTSPSPQPPDPWSGDQLTWTLPADAQLPDVDGQLAPLPTLVAIGAQPGTHLLLDLERLGLLAVTGDPDRASDLLRYLAAELALNTWSDHVEISIAGFDPDETTELLGIGTDRITAAPNIRTAIDRIRRRAGQVVQSLDHLNASDPVSGRTNDIAADAWMPHVLLVNNPNRHEIAALQMLDSDLAATGRCAVAIAITTNTTVGRWPLVVDADGTLSIGFLGLTGHDTITAARLPRTELTNLADLLSTARRGTPAASVGDPGDEADWAPIPAAPETEPWAQGTDAAGSLLTGPPYVPPPSTVDQEAEPADQHDPSDDAAPDRAEHQQVRTVASVVHPATSPNASPVSWPVPEPAEDAEAASSSDANTEEVNTLPAVVALVGRQPTRKKVSAPARGRWHTDPNLDSDLHAWHDADPARPRIAILGPVTVHAPGPLPDERVRFYAEIITYLATRGQRGATTDQFDDAIWPDQHVKANTRRVAVARARRWLGEAPDSQPWLPDATTDRRYRLRDGYLLDWHLFRRLRSRAEARGPAGTNDLHEALNLVRGAPLAGADVAYSAVARNPYPWLPTSEIQPHHLAATIVDTAHHVVELSLDGGDITSARWAVDKAWLADPDRDSDITWRDLLRVAAAEGNTAELDHLLGDLMNARDAEVPEDLDRETYRLLCDLMPERIRAGV